MPASPFIKNVQPLPTSRREPARQAIMTTGRDGSMIAMRDIDAREEAPSVQEQLRAVNARKFGGQKVSLVAITVLESL